MGIPAMQMLLVGMLPSAFKVALYRARGAKIGKNVKIGPLSVILADKIDIGDDVRIGMLSFVRARAVRLGNRANIGTAVAIDTGVFELGHDSNIMEQVVVGGMRTPRSSLRIGSRVKVFPFCFLNPTEPILIEDDVGVGGATLIFTHGSWQSELDGFPIGFGPVTLRRGVWLPWRVFILPNVEIGEYATLGAGAVVSRNIAPRALAVGMPAKPLGEPGAHLKKLSDAQRQERLCQIVDEYAELLRYDGYQTRTLGEEGARVLEAVERNGCMTRLKTLEGPHVPAVAAGDSLISLARIPDELRARASAAGASWFDIADAVASRGKDPLFDETRAFLSRFGVRFAMHGEPEFLGKA